MKVNVEFVVPGEKLLGDFELDHFAVPLLGVGQAHSLAKAHEGVGAFELEIRGERCTLDRVFQRERAGLDVDINFAGIEWLKCRFKRLLTHSRNLPPF